jgi:hypothetical protein
VVECFGQRVAGSKLHQSPRLISPWPELLEAGDNHSVSDLKHGPRVELGTSRVLQCRGVPSDLVINHHRPSLKVAESSLNFREINISK